jgi:hypothetical protein
VRHAWPAVRNIVVKSPIYALEYGFNISVTFITIGRGKQAILFSATVNKSITAKKPCPIQLDPVPLNWTHWTVTYK